MSKNTDGMANGVDPDQTAPSYYTSILIFQEHSDLGLHCLPRPVCVKRIITVIEPPHDKTNKMAYAPSEDSDQPGHPPSLIRIFAVRSVGS